MTTTTSAFTPGSLVRLTFDQGPRSIGVVTEGDQPVRDDGVTLVPVIWVDHFNVVDDLAWMSTQPGADLQPATILVPLCEYVATYPDGFGIACSEPDVPTSTPPSSCDRTTCTSAGCSRSP